MAGAHYDSWVAGDGAVDNGAGTAVVIEAARILSTMPRPRRTIRFALWSGEEQGLYGSKDYVRRHLVDRPVPAGLTGAAADAAWDKAWPITPKPGFRDLKAYFNMDNGSGRFRGLYAEGDIAAVPLLKEWMAPYHALGARRIVADATGGTDHEVMQAVGINAYQFIQDPLDYGSRLHQSSIDTYDHLRPDDLRQAATVMAGMLWAAANADRDLPRPPLPQKVKTLDPTRG